MNAPPQKETPEQIAFRKHCRQFLEKGIPAAPDFRLPQSPLEIMTEAQMDFLVAWQKRAYEAGLVGCNYPTGYGGGGLVDCQRIANEEMMKRPTCFFPNVVGLGMAAPAIYHHGTEAQKKAYLPGILSAEEIWCQGFSEPNAGSDLANVQTTAEKAGNDWVVNGQKTWTSLARFSRWMILLARHDASDKYGGLTFFIAPILEEVGRSVEVRPLVKMTGESGFNEVFFKDLHIADDRRVDDVGKGWHVAMTTLLHERGAGPLVTPRAGGGGTDRSAVAAANALRLIDLARESTLNGRSAWDDPSIRDRIMALVIREKGFEQCARRTRVKGLIDHDQRLTLQTKLVGTELRQAIGALAVEIEGARSTLYIGDPNAPEGGKWPLYYMNSYGATIAAGTSEIQRNILAERVLGLPKSK
jgi:alkylation response protein AidB-like acyl-CoA dehydrogenase